MSARINISQRGIRQASVRRKRSAGVRPFQSRRPNVFIPRRMPITQIVKRAVSRLSERKFHDNSFSTASAITWSIFSSNIVNVDEGTTNETRIGVRMNLNSIHLRCFSTIPNVESQANPVNSVLTRVLMGVSAAGGTIAVAEILDLGSTTDLLSYRNLSNTGEFSVLTDFYIMVEPTSNNEGAINSFASGLTTSKVVTYSKVWKNPLKMQFLTGSTTATKNSIWLMVISNSIGATVNIETRARFSET